MKNLLKTVSLMATMCVVSASFAAPVVPTSANRMSVRATPTSRLSNSVRVNTTTATTTTTTSSSVLSDTDCIEAYTECIKGGDVCGPNFEECTTKTLFHGKMAQCISTLGQCSAAGVASLFGSGALISNLSNTTGNVAATDEGAEFVFPTDSSVLGQIIAGAAISNRYDTSTCVKRVVSCLHKDNVCGGDFELCTTNTEFRKQRVYCDSTIARCQSEGKTELFGGTSANDLKNPKNDSRVGELITEGAALAAVNAVSTCYKVVDQCILNACATNPYKCMSNAPASTANMVDKIVAMMKDNTVKQAGDISALNELIKQDIANGGNETISGSAISGYIRNACQNTIGANKYCYATFIGNGTMPTSSQLANEDNQEEIYDAAYEARMNNSMKAQITDLVQEFDTKAKAKCTETIRACAMRVCGGGVGAACYKLVNSDNDKSINGASTYDEIKTGCAAIVNTEPYCQYAAANTGSAGSYSYAYINSDAFNTLFPNDVKKDPIGVVASLNASLANNYSDAALAQMKKQCQSVATSCVKAMCGADYSSCYRNRTDVYSTITQSGEPNYDHSMNKVGGVLDYTIVVGLCLDTVKNASVCEEHLAIERAKIDLARNSRNYTAGSASGINLQGNAASRLAATSGSWNNNTDVRSGWIDAGGATNISVMDNGEITETDENGNELCYGVLIPGNTRNGDTGPCGTSVAEDGHIVHYDPDQKVTIEYTTYAQDQAANSLFRDLVYDIEKEAQAKYNAKLTKEQNMCLAQNAGGVMGNRAMSSTYTWVKLNSNKVPKAYPTNGLKTSQFKTSNDIYNSFCLARVTIQSDDKNIQKEISNGAKWATAYFAVGDTFTCGSWIDQDDLEKIATAVGENATKDKEEQQKKTRGWLTALGALGGATGGGFLGDSIATGGILGGVTGIGTKRDFQNAKYFESCATYANNVAAATTLSGAQSDAVSAISMARNGLAQLNSGKANTNNSLTKWSQKMSLGYAEDDEFVAVNKAVNDLQNALNKNDYTESSNGSDNYDFVLDNLKTTCDGLSTLLNKGESGTENQSTTYKQVCKPVNSLTSLNAGLIATYRAVVSSEINQECNKGNGDAHCQTARSVRDVLDMANSQTSVRTVDAQKLPDIQTEARKLSDACWAARQKEGNTKQDKLKNSRIAGSVVGGTLGGVAGGLTVYYATKDIQDALLSKEQKEAYDEWMNAVGKHITCYVGATEAGDYGDTVTIEYDE